MRLNGDSCSNLLLMFLLRKTSQDIKVCKEKWVIFSIRLNSFLEIMDRQPKHSSIKTPELWKSNKSCGCVLSVRLTMCVTGLRDGVPRLRCVCVCRSALSLFYTGVWSQEHLRPTSAEHTATLPLTSSVHSQSHCDREVTELQSSVIGSFLTNRTTPWLYLTFSHLSWKRIWWNLSKSKPEK